jgi:hypothetical protein
VAVDHGHYGTQQVLQTQDMLVLIIVGPMSLTQVVGNDHGKSETNCRLDDVRPLVQFAIDDRRFRKKFLQDFGCSFGRLIQLRFFVGTQVVCQGQVKSENKKETVLGPWSGNLESIPW